MFNMHQITSNQGLYSLCGKASYCNILRIFEVKNNGIVNTKNSVIFLENVYT